MIEIRPITIKDFSQLLEMIHEFSKFENTHGAVTNSIKQMALEADHIMGFFALADGEVAGYATYFFPYHTWVGKCIHMDDLYIRAKYRGQGIGKALFEAVKETGKTEACKSLYWQVSNWNKAAQDFYRAQGATITNKEYDCSLALI